VPYHAFISFDCRRLTLVKAFDQHEVAFHMVGSGENQSAAVGG
jgi:hypothetical protein